jgi:hypothetical protein
LRSTWANDPSSCCPLCGRAGCWANGIERNQEIRLKSSSASRVAHPCFAFPALPWPLERAGGRVTTSWPFGSVVSLCSTTPLPTRTPLPLYLNDSTPGSVKEGTTRMGDSKYRYCRGAGEAVPLVWDVEIAVHDRSSDVSWRVACSTCACGEVGGCTELPMTRSRSVPLTIFRLTHRSISSHSRPFVCARFLNQTRPSSLCVRA